MISNKKSYAMKMLQLALALSLLQVDPDNYLQLHMRNWDSQLELRDGDGWELEMLRAVPMVEYPYANRKTMMPLIEDLIRYDRQNDDLSQQYNVTAYLLNVQSDSANQTAAMQELQATASTTTSSAGVAVSVSAGAVALEQAASAAASAANTNASSMGMGSAEIDLFLNSEHFQEQRSVWEQNLADLHDFGDLTVMNPYSGLPLKDEPQDNTYLDLNLEMFLPGLATAGSDVNNDLKEEESGVGAGALNDTVPNPADVTSIKIEQTDDNEDHTELLLAQLNDEEEASCSNAAANNNCIKEEKLTEEIDNDDEKDENTEVDLSPFINQVELTKEESEIVEVLWKQDVDLGYTLTPILNSSGAGGNGADPCNDEIEKLKALEELKLDKSAFDEEDAIIDDGIDDEWSRIPFTVDNETGEYIRLPLDELLDDVLQFADLAGGNNEINNDDDDDDSIASTSKNVAANKNKKAKSEGDDEDDTDKKNEDKENSNNKKNEGELLSVDSIKNKKNNNNNGDSDDEDDTDDDEDEEDDDDLSESEIEANSLPSPLFDLDDEAKEELADFNIMLQSAAPPFHHHHHPHRPTAAGVQGYTAVGGGANSAFHRQATGYHHGHHQGRMPLSRGVSMEQRLQDIASLFNPMGVPDMTPYPHYPTHHYSYQSAAAIPSPQQHGQYPPPPPPPPHPHHHHSHHAMLHPNATIGDICPTQPHYGHNLGSAVTSSMHLTNTSNHESDVGAGAAGGGGVANVGTYKMEHDMMYYSNASSDMNHTTDGFINSILNDEDLHLMDMNVNDNSFCRMVDVNNSTSNNSSVLGGGLSSGHASGGGGSTGAASSANGLSMSGATGGGAAGATTGGMTSDLMSSGAQGGVGDRLDASSDSAVSSMGSERVPSLSDGEWGEGSDSAQDYHQGKYGGPYDYSYNNSNRLNDGTRQPPVAQKKHQMFGKRFLNEQPHITGAAGPGAASGAAPAAVMHGPAQSIKYEYEPYPVVPTGGMPPNGGGALSSEGGAMGPSLGKEHQAYDLKYGAGAVGGGYSLDFTVRTPRTPHDIVQHNHTYTMPQGTGSLPRPQQRDKRTSTSSSKSSKSSNTTTEEEHQTRDEKRARALNIPITVADIINLPMDEFNERLSKYDLTENQLSLIRDIRRRGKNKVAAQNCRKRKLDQILSLEDEVKEVRRRKDQLNSDRDSLAVERKRISNKFAALHRHIFQYLRDPEGNPCSSSEYSLQQAADGSIYLLPRDSSNKTDANNSGGGAPISGGGSNANISHLNQQAAPPQHQQQHPHIAAVVATRHHHQQQQHPHVLHHTTQQQQQQQQQQHSHAHVHHHQTHQKD